MKRFFSFLVILLMTVPNFGQKYFIETFDTSPVLSDVQIPNAWYPDRYRPAAFESVLFDGQNCLKLSISENDAAINRPNGQTGTFYNTQGRKYDLGNPINSSVSVDIYIPADWATKHRRADIWGTMVDINNTPSAYPIIGFANTTGTNPTFRVYNSSDGSWIDFAINPENYGTWVNFKFEMNSDGYKYYINNALVHTISNLDNVKLNDIILQGYNFGDASLPEGQYALESYDIYFDNLKVVTNIQNVTQSKWFETIQGAVAAAVDGDVILVNDGNYNENITVNKNITLKSVNGRGKTTITGISKVGPNATITIESPSNGFHLEGFKVVGIDNENASIENAAVYFIGAGPHHNAKIISNEIVANGELALLTNFNADVKYFTIDNNIFSGKSFQGNKPDIGDQWIVVDNPRQLVVISGNDGTKTTNITFSNNQITGIAGGVTVNGEPSGNTLVTIDADNSIVAGNEFAGTTARWGVSFRCRRPGLNLTNNIFSGSGLTSTNAHLAIENNSLPAVMLKTNTFDVNVFIGIVETYPITTAPIEFGSIRTTATFNTLPSGTLGSLTMFRSTTQPTNTGTLPAGANPSLFLTIDAPGLTDHTFNATIVLSTVGLTGFSSTTDVMYYEDGSGWVAVNGTYDATAQTYTFTTDHFTPFAFVNPTNPLAVYVTMNTANVNDNIWYNHNTTTPASDDWTYTSMPVTFYVIPVGTQPLFAANFKIKWDATKASFVTLEDGNLLSNTLKQTTVAGEVTVNAANLGSTINVTPDGQKYLAKITLNITKPGYNYVMLDNIDFRFYQNDEQTSVFATTTPGAVKMYLGDFVKDADTDVNTIGDGKVNQADLFAFAPAYWTVTNAPLFKTKFDVGPTNASGNYFAMPTPDGKIEFEDLAIFAIGYGKSASNQLPKQVEQSVIFAADAPEVNGQEIRVPISVSGNVVDLRALSMTFASNLQLVRVEKAGQLDNELSFTAAKQENGIITLDAAVIGEQQSINANGVIAYLVLKGQGSVSIANVIARDSYNNAIVTKANGNAVGTVPVEFSLTQNYPNPFNPSTTISYAVAKEGLVEVAIFNSLGEKVAQLVNQVQEAGNYTVEFNANRLSSGVYFYQMTAGDFSSIKKMVLMK